MHGLPSSAKSLSTAPFGLENDTSFDNMDVMLPIDGVADGKDSRSSIFQPDGTSSPTTGLGRRMSDPKLRRPGSGKSRTEMHEWDDTDGTAVRSYLEDQFSRSPLPPSDAQDRLDDSVRMMLAAADLNGKAAMNTSSASNTSSSGGALKTAAGGGDSSKRYSYGMDSSFEGGLGGGDSGSIRSDVVRIKVPYNKEDAEAFKLRSSASNTANSSSSIAPHPPARYEGNKIFITVNHQGSPPTAKSRHDSFARSAEGLSNDTLEKNSGPTAGGDGVDESSLSSPTLVLQHRHQNRRELGRQQRSQDSVGPSRLNRHSTGETSSSHKRLQQQQQLSEDGGTVGSVSFLARKAVSSTNDVSSDPSSHYNLAVKQSDTGTATSSRSTARTVATPSANSENYQKRQYVSASSSTLKSTTIFYDQKTAERTVTQPQSRDGTGQQSAANAAIAMEQPNVISGGKSSSSLLKKKHHHHRETHRIQTNEIL